MSKNGSVESLGTQDKSKSKGLSRAKSGDSSSVHTDEGLKDNEVRLYAIDEATGAMVERKEKIGFDKVQQDRMALIGKAQEIVKIE